MQLTNWLSREGLRPAEFARLLKTDRSTVHRWVQKPGTPEARVPEHRYMVAITRLTRGHVQPNDFYPGIYVSKKRGRRSSLKPDLQGILDRIAARLAKHDLSKVSALRLQLERKDTLSIDVDLQLPHDEGPEQ